MLLHNEILRSAADPGVERVQRDDMHSVPVCA